MCLSYQTIVLYFINYPVAQVLLLWTAMALTKLKSRLFIVRTGVQMKQERTAPTNTKVILGSNNIADAIAKFQSNMKQDWCACVDYSIPAFSMSPKIRQGYVAAKERGVRIRYVTEVTAENLAYCVDLMRFVELRHLDGVQGSFAVSETEFVAGIRGKNTLAKLVYSNVKEVVEHEQDAFETLWKNAEPATVQIGNLQSKSLDS